MIGKNWWLVPAFAVAASLGGCKPSEEIRTYTVDDAPAPVAKAPSDDAKMRMLAGVIPLSDKTSYFVRFLGPIDAVSPREAEFDAFFDSIRLTDDPKRPLTWTVPPGWKVGKPRDKRLVTLNVDGAKGVEMYVSDAFGGSLLENVNRWRTSFLGLKAADAVELEALARPVMLGDKKAFRFDLRGPGGSGVMPGAGAGTN